MSSIFQVPELAIGIAVGGAAGAAFEPKLEVPKQKAWAANRVLVPDIGTIAALLAGGKITPQDADNFAARLGFDSGTLDSLTWLAQNRLDFPLMLRLWRRFGAFDAGADATLSALLDETLAHERLDWDYHPWLRRLKTAELIGLGDIATAIVRGAVPAPSWVPVAPPVTTDHVPRFPVTHVDPVQLAAAIGFDEDMLKIMTARSGLSLAPILATQANFRGALTDNDWLLAIAEGDLRTEWAATLKEAARAIPTPGEFMELRLRGWLNQADAEAGAAMHGMTAPHAELLYELRRRPLTPASITKALARGGTFQPAANELQDPYAASVHQADLGPEWYDLGEHLKYSYPSAFVLRSLLQGGVLTRAEGEQLFLEVGWKPDLAAKVATHYATATTGTADKDVTAAETRLKTATHKNYTDYEISATTATDSLTQAGVAAASIPTILGLWDTERTMTHKALTAANLKKALKAGDVNPVTNLPFTQAEIMARLEELGYSPDDATVYLEL